LKPKLLLMKLLISIWTRGCVPGERIQSTRRILPGVRCFRGFWDELEPCFSPHLFFSQTALERRNVPRPRCYCYASK
jgi:hypothetical protein